MRGLLKNISLLFLLIGGLVILTHTINSHDHHKDYFTHHYQSEQNHNDKSDSHPFHCHFLNNILITKVSINVEKPSKQLSKIFAIVNFKEFTNHNCREALFFSNSYVYSIINYFVYQSSPTRGSPYYI